MLKRYSEQTPPYPWYGVDNKYSFWHPTRLWKSHQRDAERESLDCHTTKFDQSPAESRASARKQSEPNLDAHRRPEEPKSHNWLLTPVQSAKLAATPADFDATTQRPEGTCLILEAACARPEWFAVPM